MSTSVSPIKQIGKKFIIFSILVFKKEVYDYGLELIYPISI